MHFCVSIIVCRFLLIAYCIFSAGVYSLQELIDTPESFTSVIIDFSDCTDGDIRLISIGNPLEGRVEVCHEAVWGTVCSNGWETAEANVACKQLGYSRSGIKYTVPCIILTLCYLYRSYCEIFFSYWTRNWSNFPLGFKMHWFREKIV